MIEPPIDERYELAAVKDSLTADERKAAEHAYTVSAFDYEKAPVGSRDWTLFWSGWQKCAAQKAQPPCGADGAVQCLRSALDSLDDWDAPEAAAIIRRFLASHPTAPVAPATVAVPDEVMAALDRMCTPLHESILKGATAASDAASMKVIRDYILATHPQGVRAVPGEYVLVPVNPTREMISAGDAANDGIVSDIYRAMVSQVVKESFTTAVPRVPFSMPDAAVERIYDAARRSFRRFASSVRGQMVTKAGGYEWHVINATLDEVRSMLDASQREGGGT